MHAVIAALLAGRDEVGPADWHGLWDRLGAGELDRAEVAALLAAMTARLPGPATLGALVSSLRERGRGAPGPWPGTVNVVGTGGGPRTFNVSTAAAFVAAAMGVRVVKTGSRAHTGRTGSIDLLDRLGVRLTRSHADTEDALARFGVAFAGPHVYPAELTRMARALVPLGMRPFGGLLNALGPFLAAAPVAAQVTGVSAAAPLPALRGLAAAADRRIWLCANDVGADELLGFADNVIHPNDAADPVRLAPGALTGSGGSLDDLAEAGPDALVGHFRAVLSGAAGPVATDTVCLNAAALAVAAGHTPDWRAAVALARGAVADGAALALLDRVGAGAGEVLARG